MMRGDPDVTITLTRAQIARVVRGAAGDAGSALMLSALGDLQDFRNVLLARSEDASISRSTCRALLVLLSLSVNNSFHEVTEIAKQLGLSPSTTHRYIRTWVALGLLEQDPESRRYRRLPASTNSDEHRTATSVGDSDAH
jgi:hypothetical protein